MLLVNTLKFKDSSYISFVSSYHLIFFSYIHLKSQCISIVSDTFSLLSFLFTFNKIWAYFLLLSINYILIVNYISLAKFENATRSYIHNYLAHENLLVIEERDLETDQVISYIKGSFLGKGGFARCYELVSHDKKEIQAVKIIQKNSLTKPRSRLKLESEIRIHQTLQHKNIVSFRRHF